MTDFWVGKRRIGQGAPVFVIAEAGVNHNGDPDLAAKLIDVASAAGADAVKFQTFRADQVATEDAPKAEYQLRTTGAAESQRDMLRRLELTPLAHRRLMAHARERGILFLSTPADEASVDLLVELDLPVLKVGSAEITNLPFLRYLASRGRPIILSTGMARLGEVDDAIEVVRAAGDPPLALLHCVSHYPADPADANLRAMATMAAAYRVPVGWSDHTRGVAVSFAAVALGASIIEKHFTVDRGLPGPDHEASLEPAELAELVAGIRIVESALGDGIKRPRPVEVATAKVGRRSLASKVAIAAGEVVTEDQVTTLRPATGLQPSLLPLVIGRRARRAIAKGVLLSLDMFE